MATGGGKAEGRAGPKVRRHERAQQGQVTVSGGLAAEEEGAERRDLPLGDELTVLAPQGCLHHRVSNHRKQWPKTITIVYFAHESAV